MKPASQSRASQNHWTASPAVLCWSYGYAIKFQGRLFRLDSTSFEPEETPRELKNLGNCYNLAEAIRAADIEVAQ